MLRCDGGTRSRKHFEIKALDKRTCPNLPSLDFQKKHPHLNAQITHIRTYLCTLTTYVRTYVAYIHGPRKGSPFSSGRVACTPEDLACSAAKSQTFIRTHTRMHTHARACIRTFVRKCVCKHSHVWQCVYIYRHKHLFMLPPRLFNSAKRLMPCTSRHRPD